MSFHEKDFTDRGGFLPMTLRNFCKCSGLVDSEEFRDAYAREDLPTLRRLVPKEVGVLQTRDETRVRLVYCWNGNVYVF